MSFYQSVIQNMSTLAWAYRQIFRFCKGFSYFSPAVPLIEAFISLSLLCSLYLFSHSFLSLSLFSQTVRSSHGPSLPDWLFAHNKGMGFGNWVALILIKETLNKIYLEIALIGSPTPWSSRAGLIDPFLPLLQHTHTHSSEVNAF